MRPLETEQKALEINLDEKIYGAFAEIGAGQEVARHFFQVGAAAGTIAKTMSAYDKTVSDDIYGPEAKGRYVCESRLYKMLNHEFELLENRLRAVRPGQNFFVFADTVTAINFHKTIKGSGWLGVRFQRSPGSLPNDLVVHARLLDNDNRLQQQAVGILGVNMIYACFRFADDPEMLLRSLLDNLRDRVAIDLMRLQGPDFQEVDNRLLCLWLVKNGLSKVAIFGPDARPIHASEFLYKKSILIARGSYRPPTLVQQDMMENAIEQFCAEPDVDPEKTFFLTEITLDNLRSGGQLDERDFLDRAEMLCQLGQTVIVSDCLQHKKLIAYFSEYKIGKIGLVMGARKLENILRETFEQNQDNLLAAFGELFPRNVKVYVYPANLKMENGNWELLTTKTLAVPPAISFIFKHLIETGQITDIQKYDPGVLHIFHKQVLRMIQNGEPGWESTLPEKVAEAILGRGLFRG